MSKKLETILNKSKEILAKAAGMAYVMNTMPYALPTYHRINEDSGDKKKSHRELYTEYDITDHLGCIGGLVAGGLCLVGQAVLYQKIKDAGVDKAMLAPLISNLVSGAYEILRVPFAYKQ
jgi:hypothetical protein